MKVIWYALCFIYSVQGLFERVLFKIFWNLQTFIRHKQYLQDFERDEFILGSFSWRTEAIFLLSHINFALENSEHSSLFSSYATQRTQKW